MISSLFMMLQEAAPRTGRPSMMPFLIQMVAIIAIFYFLLIRPQRKLREKHQTLLSNLQKNDEVMTEGGLIGHVVHIQEDRVTLRTAENTRVVVARAKIARVFTGDDAGSDKSGKSIPPGVVS